MIYKKRNKLKALLLVLVLFIGFLFGGIVGGIKNQKITVQAQSPSSATLSQQVITGISKKSHPYILYESGDVATLKERVKSGYSAKAYAYVSSQAKKYLSATISVSSSSAGIIGRQLQSYVSYLATYGMLTGDTQYTKKAVELVMSAVNAGSVTIYHSINDALCVSDFGYAYALAYDWLYNSMTSQQRTLLKSEMEEIGNYIYTNSSSLNTWGSTETRRKAWNWNAITHGALGMIAVSLGSHQDWLTLAITRMRDYYTYAVDSTGAAMEGLHYIGYALNTLAALDCVVYDMTGTEVLDDYPAMRLLPEWSMRMTAPYGNEQAAVGQGAKLDNYAPMFYIINRYSLTTELWGFERTYNVGGSLNFTSDYAGNGWNAPGIIFYENKKLTPAAPSDSLALTKTYQKGLVVARDGWDANDSLMTFTCGYGYAGCWNHPDDNSFTFFADGESYVIDLGAGKLTSAHHNVVQVDGEGMRYTGGSSMVEGTMLANTTLGTGALYLKGDNSESYNDSVLKESTRQLVYQGGEVPYVLAFDYGYVDTKTHTYTTNFYTDYDSKVTVDSSNKGKAKIIGGNKQNVGYAYVYSPSGAKFEVVENATDKSRALKTTVSAVSQIQATLFITDNRDGSEPTVAWSNAGNGKVSVSITYEKDNKLVQDSYTISSAKVESASSKILKKPVNTQYGTISSEYEDASAYPFAVFKDGAFLGASTTWKNALDIVKGHSYGANASSAVQVLLRRDYATVSADSYGGNFSQISSFLLDLNGYTLTSDGAYLLDGFAKVTEEQDGTGAKTIHNTTAAIKNGTLLAKGCAIGNINHIESSDYTSRKTFRFTFDSVTFGLAAGSTVQNVIFETWWDGSVGCNAEIAFNDCTFDFKTVTPTKAITVMNFDDTKNASTVSAVINGGDILANSLQNITFCKTLGSDDRVLFGKFANAYTVLDISVTELAPLGVISTENGNMYFQKDKTDGKYYLDVCRHSYANVCDTVCDICSQTRVVGHVFDNSCDTACNTAGCNATRITEHTGGTATCTQKAICETCGEAYGALKAHNPSTAWHTDDDRHWQECACGYKAREAAHEYGEWVVIKEATVSETGTREKSCECGHKISETIAKKEEPDTPDSTDSTQSPNGGAGNDISVGCFGSITGACGILGVFSLVAGVIFVKKQKERS